MNQEPVTPVRTYRKTIKLSEDKVDKALDIILSVYDAPVVKTPSIFLFNKVVVMEGDIEWGHGLIQDPIPDEEAEDALNQIAININKYKNK